MDREIVWNRFKENVCNETGIKMEYFNQWKNFEEYCDYLMENWKGMEQSEVDRIARDLKIISKNQTIVRQEDGSCLVVNLK